MKRLEQSKAAYDCIRIPDRLNEVVTAAIARADDHRKGFHAGRTDQAETNSTYGQSEHMKIHAPYSQTPKGKGLMDHKTTWKYRIRRFCYYSLGTAAAMLVIITLKMNSDPVFAKEIQDIPILGAIVRLLTAESYSFGDLDTGISVEVPAIELIREDNAGLAERVNREIKEKCDTYAREALVRAQEYKQAFLETGGTQEEWIAHDIWIRVWYEKKSQTNQYLSFLVAGIESWTTAYSQACYYNLDLTDMKYVTLEDLLGEQYIEIANESISRQIAEREILPDNQFFSPEEGGFETITEDVSFYINEKGNPVIVFEKYTIAPGFMGALEFEIEKPQQPA